MAIREYYTNAVETGLNGSLDNSQTSVAVDDGSSFPLANFRVRVEDEIMFCTSRSGNTLTVVRGVEGTSAVAHDGAEVINHVITAGALDAIKADLKAMMGYGRRPTSGNTYGDEFDDENFSGWTAVNSGAAPLFTVVEQEDMLSLLHPGGGASGQWVSYMKDTGGSLSTGNRIEAYVTAMHNSGAFPQFTLWMADGATYGAGNQAGFAFSPHENCYVSRGCTNYNNQTSFTNTNAGVSQPLAAPVGMHMAMEWRGSNQYHMEISRDGLQWVRIFTNVTPRTFTPQYIGFGFTTWGGTFPAQCILRNFRTNF
jgi:hypothetical protein